MTTKLTTLDFHVTSECNQECPYCWGPQDYDYPVDTETAKKIIGRIEEWGARRIVFTGGDPLKRPDIGDLIRYARTRGLEVALSTTGDELTPEFLEEIGPYIDLISLPLDGSTEEVNGRTKQPGHFTAVMRALAWLRDQPGIDVKVCTPVTRHNLEDVANIVTLVEEYAGTTEARVFYNIFQAYPRAMGHVDWDELIVGDDDFSVLESELAGRASVRVNFLSHETLERLYVMVFPDGSLVIPRGREYQSFGHFLEVKDPDSVLDEAAFDSPKHLQHSRGWSKRA